MLLQEPGALGDVAVLVLRDPVERLQVAGQDPAALQLSVWKYWPVSASVPSITMWYVVTKSTFASMLEGSASSAWWPSTR